jgi:hypothetical protein
MRMMLPHTIRPNQATESPAASKAKHAPAKANKALTSGIL